MTFWQEAWLRRQETCGTIGLLAGLFADCHRGAGVALEKMKTVDPFFSWYRNKRIGSSLHINLRKVFLGS